MMTVCLTRTVSIVFLLWATWTSPPPTWQFCKAACWPEWPHSCKLHIPARKTRVPSIILLSPWIHHSLQSGYLWWTGDGSAGCYFFEPYDHWFHSGWPRRSSSCSLQVDGCFRLQRDPSYLRCNPWCVQQLWGTATAWPGAGVGPVLQPIYWVCVGQSLYAHWNALCCPLAVWWNGIAKHSHFQCGSGWLVQSEADWGPPLFPTWHEKTGFGVEWSFLLLCYERMLSRWRMAGTRQAASWSSSEGRVGSFKHFLVKLACGSLLSNWGFGGSS